MSVTIDIASVIKEIRESLQIVNDARVERKKRRDRARLVVYHALSLHPALDSLRLSSPFDSSFRTLCTIYAPPNQSPSWFGKVFLGRRDDKHFTKLARLGKTGTRARVMLILLWIIGNTLDDQSVESLISNVCESGIKLKANLPEPETLELVNEIATLGETFVSLRKTIKKKLPIKRGRNPYEGLVLEAGDQEGGTGHACPHVRLQHPYNVHDDPLFLLQRLPAPVDHAIATGCSVIIPQNKLTRLIVDWSIKNYQLGKEVSTEADIDPQAYWHAHCRCEHDAGGQAR